jgi:ABC-type Fe3+-hydroxamate transport system substrate-binding protein
MILQSVNELAFKPSSIISLVPSQTELLYFLGLDKEVTGITKFCVHPAEWRKTKKITGGTKNIKPGIIKQLCPDLIIANKEENKKEQVEELAKYYNIWLTDVINLQDALQMIKDIGKLTGTDTKASELATQIEIVFEQLDVPHKKIRTCYLIWQEPYMTVGGDTFINDMLSKCGFENIYVNQTRYPLIEIEQLKVAGCELLILSSEPYPFKQKHSDTLQQQLPNTRIILADGEMFSWYGSRLLKAADYFAKLIDSI